MNTNKNIYKKIDNSFASIFNSIFQYKAMLKLLQNTKARYVISDSTPNRPYARRLFFAASKVSVCTIQVLTKVIFGNNSGYKFNFNKMKCDQLGIADYYLVSTASAKKYSLIEWNR